MGRELTIESHDSLERERRPAARRRLFVAVTTLIPFLVFASAEIALRLLGVGDSYPLFVDATNRPGYLEANPRVIERFYPRAPDLAIDPIPFARVKPPGSYRIVVQGGSTAAGFPFGRWGGLAGMLGDRLEAAFPDREIEVISTAMAAVNSYTLLDFSDEIIDVQPDAILVYAGHNEYLGILGVASALSSAGSRTATRLHIALRRLRLYQAAQGTIGALRAGFGSPGREAAGDRGALMSLAAAGAKIPFGSDVDRRGALQLEANFRAMFEKYREAGIPVYVGSLVSNERDQRPFAGGPPPDADPVAWRRLWQAFVQAAEGGHTGARRRALAALLAQDDRAADPWFELGRLEQEQGNAEAARQAYRNAKDRDALRFRAPEAFNERIRALAERDGVTLVDVQARFAAASPDGIVGGELMLEHLHPNAEGCFLLADAFFEALKRDGALGDWSRAPSSARAVRDMPITVLDRVLAEHAVRELMAAYPFSETTREVAFPHPRNRVERLAQQRLEGELDWLSSMEQLHDLLRGRGRLGRAMVVARLVAQAYPQEAQANLVAGVEMMEQWQYARARRYIERSLRSKADDPDALNALVRANLALGDDSRARESFARLKAVAPTHPAILELESIVAPAPAGS